MSQNKIVTVLTDGLVMKAVVENGELKPGIGRKAKVESMEMNMVKVTYPTGEQEYLELGEDVRWLQEDGEDCATIS